MVLTGRTGLVALICVLPIALSPSPATTFAALLITLTIAVLLDVVLAASTAKLRYVRAPDRSARLGQQVDCGLLIHNDGPRRLRGQIRDAWPPSAGARPRIHPIDIPAGQHQHVQTQLQPVRRGDQRATVVTARSIGPLGLAGRQGSRPVPGQLRVLPHFWPASTCRRGWPSCGRSTACCPRWYAGREPNSIRCASMSSGTTCARSTGAPPRVAPMWWCAPGGPNATGGW